MAMDDLASLDLERDANGGVRSPTDSCPSDTDSCPSDTDSCPSDTDSCPSDDPQDEENTELPELKTFSPKKPPLQRRKSSIQRMMELVLDKDEVSYVTNNYGFLLFFSIFPTFNIALLTIF